MKDFLGIRSSSKLFRDEIGKNIEIPHNKTCDWSVYICKKGCAEDYPNSEKYENDAVICMAQSCDMESAFAKAQVQLIEWLSEHEGGY